MRFMDIVICFDILIELKEKGMSCIHITNKMLEIWNVEFKTILEHAVVNTSKLLPYRLEQIAGSEDDLDFEEWGSEFADSGIEEVQLRKVYLLTNCVSSFGAGTLLYPDILKQIADEIGDDIVILPNSLHEVLIVAMSTFYKHEVVDVCYEMLSDGNNESDVAVILSDKVYAYKRSTGKFGYLEDIVQNN